MRHVLIASLAVVLLSPTGHAAEMSIAGAWVLNKDLTPMPDGAQRRPEDAPHRGGRGGGGVRGGGRGPGREVRRT